jgi:hypothetical protein
MEIPADIVAYVKAQDAESKLVCNSLIERINNVLTKAESKVWHGHPVWFVEGNPIVGISKKKAGVEILFWSGQSFKKPGLKAIGKFKAAGVIYESIEDVKISTINSWLQESKKVQWDYKNLPKRRQLEKLTDF